MKLGNIKTISREDLSKHGELPAWIDPFLTTINSFIEQVGRAVQNNLTFGDNFACKVKELTFTHAVELTINPEAGKSKVIGVIPLSTGELGMDVFNWSAKSNGNIGVRINFSSGTSAKVRILILLG